MAERHGIAALCLAGAAVGLIASEGIVRWAYPALGARPLPDRALGWSTEEYQALDAATVPRKGRRKLLFIGDSFLAGAGVRDPDQRFPLVVGRMSDGEIDPIILASGGWGTDQELLAYLQKGRAARPDEVVLAFCANNDISDIVSNGDRTKRKPYFVLEDEDALRFHGPDGRGWEVMDTVARMERPPRFRSRLFELARYALLRQGGGWTLPDADDSLVDARYRAFGRFPERHEELYREQARLTWAPQLTPTHVSAYIHDRFALNAYQWRLLERLLSELAREVRASGARFTVLLLPVIYDPERLETVVGGPYVRTFATPTGPFTFRSAEPRERLLDITRRLGIEMLDPTAGFVTEVKARSLFARVWPNPSDRHFSEVGHQVLARQLLPLLIRKE